MGSDSGLRGASPAKGQAVKPGTGSSATTPNDPAVRGDNRGHVKGSIPKTLATRKPRKWGGG